MKETLAAALMPYGAALEACFAGDTSCALLVRRDDGLEDCLPVRHFFREEPGFSPLERLAIEQCHGHVLDIGAGVGAHSLPLQARGHRVTALDISPAAARIMRTRGVTDVICGDVFELRDGIFDTALLLGHGIGMVGDVAGLDCLLDHVRPLLRQDGTLVLDSLDVTCSRDPRHRAYHESNRRAGRYVGETRIQFEFAGEPGPFCAWLHVDQEILGEHARSRGWTCTVLLEDAGGEYLARLTPSR